MNIFSLTTSTTISTIKIKTRSFSIQLLRKANWLANTSSSKSVIQIKLNAPIDIDMLEKLFSFSLLKLESIVLVYRDNFFFISIALTHYFSKHWLLLKSEVLIPFIWITRKSNSNFLLNINCLIAIIHSNPL